MLLPNTVEKYLQKLCLEMPSRRVGSAGNRAATYFFADRIATFGFKVESPVFDCLDWSQDGADLRVGGTSFEVFVSPYSLGCRESAPLIVVSQVAELETVELAGKIVLLRGTLAQEQLMPKNFPFYNPDEHKRIIQLLENKKPCAIVAATSKNAEMAGAVYPFPLIEDGDFKVPSVYMTEEEGDRLAVYAGRQIFLDIRTERKPALGYNVIARKGAKHGRRVVLFAHIDAKDNTSGALDDATGTIVLLLVAELLAVYTGDLMIEIVALNGEDYYSNPGEQLYLESNADRFPEIVLGINLDGVGYYKGKTAYSMYDCNPALAALIRKIFLPYKEMSVGEPWYQGDHGLFLMNQRPALALTSERVVDIMTSIAHTPQDRPELVATSKLLAVATALHDLLVHLE